MKEPWRSGFQRLGNQPGRIYIPGTPLQATRTRKKSAPLTLILTGNYAFNWQRVLPGSEWYSLEVRVVRAG